jgi:hypothetical protein
MTILSLLVTTPMEIVAATDGPTCFERIMAFLEKPVAAAAVLLH